MMIEMIIMFNILGSTHTPHYNEEEERGGGEEKER